MQKISKVALYKLMIKFTFIRTVVFAVCWLMAAAFLPAPVMAAGQTYYIDPSCAYSGDGQAQGCALGAGQAGAKNSWDNLPWQAGDSYLQRRDTTWTGQLAPDAGGAPEAIISLGAYGQGQKPVVRNTTGPALFINNRNYLAIRDFRFIGQGHPAAFLMSNWESLHNVSLTDNDFEASATGENYTVYFYITAGQDIWNIDFTRNTITNPADQVTADGVRVYVPGAGTMHSSRFVGNNFRNIGGSALRFFAANNAGLVANDNRPYGLTIEGNFFSDIGNSALSLQAGLKMQAGARSLISRNIAERIGSATRPNVNAFQLHWSEGAIISHNIINDVRTSVPDGVGIILDWLTAETASTTTSDDNDIFGNRVSGCLSGPYSAGIAVWAGRNNRIERNVLVGNSVGASLSQAWSADNVFNHNLLLNNTYGGNIDDVFGAGAPASQWFNNIFQNNGRHWRLANNSRPPKTGSNLYYGHKFAWSEGWAEAIEEAGAILTEPRLDSNYRLRTDSPAIDAGQPLPTSISQSVIYGTADIGPFEAVPDQIFGDYAVDAVGAIAYADGAYRLRGPATGRTVALAIFPLTKASSGHLDRWVELAIGEWSATSRNWSIITASSSVIEQRLANLQPQAAYRLTGAVVRDRRSCTSEGVCVADNQGHLTVQLEIPSGQTNISLLSAVPASSAGVWIESKASLEAGKLLGRPVKSTPVDR
jgi:hypothetical protein